MLNEFSVVNSIRLGKKRSHKILRRPWSLRPKPIWIMKLFLEVLTDQKEWHSHDFSAYESGNCDAARFWLSEFWRIAFKRRKEEGEQNHDEIFWRQQKIFFFLKALREYVARNNPFLKTKSNGRFAHQSSAANDDLHGKAINLLRDGFTSIFGFFFASFS